MRNFQGFSLMELIITIAILLIIIVPALNMLYFSATANLAAQAALDASIDLQRVMEGIKGCEDLLGLHKDGNEHLLPTDSSIRYAIEPVSFYDVDHRSILYQIRLSKVIDDEILLEMRGTTIVE
ncbi:MAG: prepilin-type N-terminal cleavage/methylation domain-containing protein [Eubacteriales bacterium]|nr:prepilin-type N-terminal cleavage/methylation domain-containing protein [Eubacteriales bacterium]